jgi:predicted ATPase
MQSWRLLQLEPSALREPDSFNAPVRLGPSGAHLAATLYHLAKAERAQDPWDWVQDWKESAVFARAANRLSQLIDDVREVWIDRDERRELLTLYVKDKYGTSHPARALSDGTLRFLALAVLELDAATSGVLCLEEPENGIHPERIPAMLELLQDIAIDVGEPQDPENPLRQVIINTHSPAVVTQVPDDSLLMAELKEAAEGLRRFNRLQFSCLSDTWRAEDNQENITSRGSLLAYLNPTIGAPQDHDRLGPKSRLPKTRGKRRVVDRPDIQILLPFGGQV